MHLLKKSTAASADERAFLQRRVGLFGLLAGACYLFFLIFRILSAPSLREFCEPSAAYHLLASICFLSIWLLCRVGTHSLRFIRIVETAGLLVASGATVMMGAHIPLHGRPDYILVIALTIALTARALYVPSSARRTLGLSIVVGLQLVSVVYTIYLKIDPKPYLALAPNVASMTPNEIATALASNAAAWWAMTVATTTLASRVIYGLRQDIRDAKQLGQYHLEHKIGEGGMGAVYKASHAMLRRPTAVKLLLPDRAGPANLRRFEKEVQQTARLSHPNIITIFDYGHTADDVFYYAMEFLDGMTLSDLVGGHGPQPVARVQHLLKQIGAALVHAHGEGLIHRDIKSANIMLNLPHQHGGQHEQIKLLDFGLVKELRDTGGIDVTHANTISGTPQYMSPESIRTPDSVDGRSDLYAVGAVAFYLLTGRHVFEGESVIEVCGHHLNTDAPPVSAHAPGPIPDGLERLIMSCLAKDPAERPASALIFLQALEQLPQAGNWGAEEALRWWQKHGRGSSIEAPNDISSEVKLLTIDAH